MRSDQRYRLGDLVFDRRTEQVRVRGRPIALTRPQVAILRALFEAGGATLSREDLIARVGLASGGPTGRTVDLHVSRLRRRLGDDAGSPRYIEAVYGAGYRLVPERGDPSDGDVAAAVLDALPEAVLILDERLVIRDANPAAQALLARSREEIVGLACSQVTACQSCEGLSMAGEACLGRAALAGEDARDVRALVRGPDGAVPVVFTHVRVIPDTEVRLVAVTMLRP